MVTPQSQNVHKLPQKRLSQQLPQWRSQNEAEEAMAPLETNLRRFLLVLYINLTARK